jgi:hypothetical protein
MILLCFRHKVHELIDFIQDDDKLREERKKAKKNKDKYVGMSSDAMGMRFGKTQCIYIILSSYFNIGKSPKFI